MIFKEWIVHELDIWLGAGTGYVFGCAPRVLGMGSAMGARPMLAPRGQYGDIHSGKQIRYLDDYEAGAVLGNKGDNIKHIRSVLLSSSTSVWSRQKVMYTGT